MVAEEQHTEEQHGEPPPKKFCLDNTGNKPTACTTAKASAVASATSDVDTGATETAAETATADAAAIVKAKGTEGRVRWMTTKREFRARAHSNPLNDGMFTPPAHPGALPLERWYGAPTPSAIDWCDIGCGYGGLLASLSAAFPERTMLGLEIRDRVAEFCRRRVLELRREHPGEYGNVFFERTNAMKYLPHYFGKASLTKLFFCYPDPHFKRKKNRQRIISQQLLDEYAFVLRPAGGVAYIVTDVDELFEWMVSHFEKHPLFERRSEQVHRADPVAGFVRDMTDEAQRVEKSNRTKQDASFRRLPNP